MSSRASCRLAFMIALVITFAAPSAVAQARPTGPQRSSLASPGPTSGNADTVQVALLRAALAAEREHNSSLLATVYWSLGTTATVALALLGFGWFVNFRVYQRDVEGLTKALNADLTTAVAKVTDDLKVQQAARDTADRGWQAELEARVRMLVTTVTDDRFESLTRAAETNARRLNEVRLDYLLFKADVLGTRQLYGNAFTTYIDAAHLAHRLELSHMVNSTISQLDKLVRSMDGLFASDIQKLTQFLNGVEGADDTLTERLADAVRSAKSL